MMYTELKRGEQESRNRDDVLLIGLNRNGEIVQFNKECEHITGYHRNEVLQRNIRDFLIPKRYREKWLILFDSLLQNVWPDEFVFPLQTSQQNELSVSWICFPITDRDRLINTVCLLGKYEKTDSIKEPPLKIGGYTSPECTKTSENQFYGEMASPVTDKRIIFKIKNKYLVFSNKRYTPIEKPGKEYEQITLKSLKPIKQLPALKKVEVTSNSMKEYEKKYKTVNRRLKELEKKDRKLEQKNKMLEKQLKHLESLYLKYDTVQEKQDGDTFSFKSPSFEDGPPSNKLLDFFHDPLGVKRRQKEFEKQTHVIDERKKELDKLNAGLLKEKETLDGSITQLRQWREKLEVLEEEIEKRREVLIEQENEFEKTLSLNSQVQSLTDALDSSVPKEEEPDYEKHHDILDRIPQSAAIVQRGILKQINDSFASLVGYSSEEIVEKSFFDFIAPDGFAEIEKYYLHRLKGDESCSSYRTMFLTKDNVAITVEVNVKPTTYAGEKAEIAVVTTVQDQVNDRKPFNIEQ